jgi:hypothetical protein
MSDHFGMKYGNQNCPDQNQGGQQQEKRAASLPYPGQKQAAGNERNDHGYDGKLEKTW